MNNNQETEDLIEETRNQSRIAFILVLQISSKFTSSVGLHLKICVCETSGEKNRVFLILFSLKSLSKLYSMRVELNLRLP